ncbi:MAG TPA: class I SAM-dependent methyltransferase [Anaerolineaceae bacterium]|nr:class I SAM-dependent methyltransferase [Anaerolineaceae bacterium]HPN50885.1 class I SAM-dependent methyltransferase [Anaerolineaceae bacterium]
MKINYQETTSDLQTRIDIHNKFGGRNIDEWMLDLLKPQKGISILDVACGSGKQCFSFHKYCEGDVRITGGDVNPDLLSQAREQNAKIGSPVTFMDLNFNVHFPLQDNTFDLASCCFAIYYAEDIPFTISEIHRVIKPGGRLFTTGPMPDNKKLFYDIIREATGKTIPPMPGSSRYSTQIFDAVKGLFTSTQMHIFLNPLTFETVEPFVDYTRASLAEDRKLWSSFFQDKDDFERIMEKINETAKRWIDRDGKLVMTKVVGGILATK